jgi:hypothetical protein
MLPSIDSWQPGPRSGSSRFGTSASSGIRLHEAPTNALRGTRSESIVDSADKGTTITSLRAGPSSCGQAANVSPRPHAAVAPTLTTQLPFLGWPGRACRPTPKRRVRHPHAVDVTDVGSEGGQTFLVMELLEGEDLGSFIEWRGRLPLQQAADAPRATSTRLGSSSMSA